MEKSLKVPLNYYVISSNIQKNKNKNCTVLLYQGIQF